MFLAPEAQYTIQVQKKNLKKCTIDYFWGVTVGSISEILLDQKIHSPNQKAFDDVTLYPLGEQLSVTPQHGRSWAFVVVTFVVRYYVLCVCVLCFLISPCDYLWLSFLFCCCDYLCFVYLCLTVVCGFVYTVFFVDSCLRFFVSLCVGALLIILITCLVMSNYS